MNGRRALRPAAFCRVACLLIVAAVLAGCDKCGDWYSPLKLQTEACRDQAPRPQ